MTAPDETPGPGGPKKAARTAKAPAKKQAATKKATPAKAAAKKTATPAAGGPAKKATRPPRPAEAPRPRRDGRPSTSTTWSIVGAGPSGASCAYWLADAGWDVVVVEKKEFPREKTCGDGLTPRAVRQLADMDLEGALAGSHRYGGLRAFGFGRSIDMQWPEHPNFPNYGYTITRHDLDGLVAGHAEAAGATLLQGTEVTGPVVDEGATVLGPAADPDRRDRQGEGQRHDPDHQGPLRRGGGRLQLADRPHARHVQAPRPPHGHGPARLLPLGPPRRSLH